MFINLLTFQHGLTLEKIVKNHCVESWVNSKILWVYIILIYFALWRDIPTFSGSRVSLQILFWSNPEKSTGFEFKQEGHVAHCMLHVAKVNKTKFCHSKLVESMNDSNIGEICFLVKSTKILKIQLPSLVEPKYFTAAMLSAVVCQ